MADGLIRLGSNVTGFAIACLGNETFLPCCGLPHVIHLHVNLVCRCFLGTVLHKTLVVKYVQSYDSVLVS